MAADATRRYAMRALFLIPLLLSGAGVLAQQSRRPQPVTHAPGQPEPLTYEAGATAPNSARLLTSGEETAGVWSLVELTEMPGTKTTWHRHPRSDQAYFVLEGVFTVKVEEQVHELRAGGYVFIPRGTRHGHANFGADRVKVLLTNTPAGFERYLHARAELLKTMKGASPEFAQRMSELRQQYDIEELGVWDIPKPGQDIGRLATRNRQREGERAAIEKLQQRYIAATLSRDAVALSDLWTDDAIRFTPGQPAEVGKQSIRWSNDRWAAREGVQVLSYVLDTKDVTMLDGWAVEWGHFTASSVDSTGGEAKERRGMVLTVLKKLRDGGWKWFRRMGDTLIAPGGLMREDLLASKGTIRGAAPDVAAIEKARRQSFAATVSRDPVALTDGWTDDGVLLAPGGPQVGKAAIRAYYERQTVNKGFKVLSYVPEVVDLAFLNDGWAVEWRSFTASYVDAPDGEPKQARGTVLLVWRKPADGNWKAFRALGM